MENVESDQDNAARHGRKVVLLDDQEAVRGLVGLLLTREIGGFEVVGETASADEALQLCCHVQPEFLIMDFGSQGLPILKFVEGVRQVSPSTRILVFSRWNRADFVQPLVDAGIHGLVLKGDPVCIVQQAVCTLQSGGMYFSPVVERLRNGAKTSNARLTEREKMALCLIAEGHSTKEVASVLGISVKTAEKYRERIMRKLNLHDVVRLTHFAIRNGLVAP